MKKRITLSIICIFVISIAGSFLIPTQPAEVVITNGPSYYFQIYSNGLMQVSKGDMLDYRVFEEDKKIIVENVTERATVLLDPVTRWILHDKIKKTMRSKSCEELGRYSSNTEDSTEINAIIGQASYAEAFLPASQYRSPIGQYVNIELICLAHSLVWISPFKIGHLLEASWD